MDKIFEKSKNDLLGTVNILALVVEKNIEEFIFSFFNHYDIVIENGKPIGKLNPSIKKDIVFVNNKDFHTFYRDRKLFNEIDNEIILTHEEIEFINSGYFEKKINNVYEQIEKETLTFYFENKTTYKQNVIETFIELEKRINDNIYNDLNYSGRISNFYELNISLFRQFVKNKYSLFNELIVVLKNNLIKSEREDLKDLAWINIFKEENDFKKFKMLIEEENIINPYLDLSYIFTELLEDKKIYKLQYNYICDWLHRYNFIKDNDKSILLSKKSFENKSKTEYRMSIYSKYFL